MAPFGMAYELGIPGCPRVMALVNGGIVDESYWFVLDQTLENVMLTRLFGDWHITCLAILELFPPMTRRDLWSKPELVQLPNLQKKIKADENMLHYCYLTKLFFYHCFDLQFHPPRVMPYINAALASKF